MQTPQLLELSGKCLVIPQTCILLIIELGIGDKAILTPLGIKTVIDLPGVGANLQVSLFIPETNPSLIAFRPTGPSLRCQPVSSSEQYYYIWYVSVL